MPEHGVQRNCCLIVAAVKHPMKRLVCIGKSDAIGCLQIGVMYGNPEVTSGGNALKFYASVRLEVRRKATQESSKGDSIGIRVKAKVNASASCVFIEVDMIGKETFGCRRVLRISFTLVVAALKSRSCNICK